MGQARGGVRPEGGWARGVTKYRANECIYCHPHFRVVLVLFDPFLTLFDAFLTLFDASLHSTFH